MSKVYSVFVTAVVVIPTLADSEAHAIEQVMAKAGEQGVDVPMSAEVLEIYADQEAFADEDEHVCEDCLAAMQGEVQKKLTLV